MNRRTRRPYGRRLPPGGPVGIVLLVLLLALATWRFWPLQGRLPPPEALAERTYPVQRVVDGDTLLLTNGARIRLIGVDTPETFDPNRPEERWGPEATAFTEEFVSGGEVRLQLDREQKDKYDRFLAYVWVGDRMLNEELIRAGLSPARTGFRYSESMKRRFRRAEKEARRARRGLWSADQ